MSSHTRTLEKIALMLVVTLGSLWLGSIGRSVDARPPFGITVAHGEVPVDSCNNCTECTESCGGE